MDETTWLVALRLRILEDPTLGDLHSAVLAYHDGNGTRDPRRTAHRQAYTAWLLAEGYSQGEIAGRVGVSDRTATRDVEVLRRIYEPRVRRGRA